MNESKSESFLGPRKDNFLQEELPRQGNNVITVSRYIVYVSWYFNSKSNYKYVIQKDLHVRNMLDHLIQLSPLYNVSKHLKHVKSFS